MVTIYRAFGLRVVIFVNDHEPAHVHVFGDGEAKINLTGPADEPDLVWAMGMNRSEVRRAMAVVVERRADFIAQWRKSMADLTDVEIDAALERGRRLHASEPRAAAATYDPGTGKVIVELTNGCMFAFPARLVQGLAAATDEDLAALEVLPQGRGLHWEGLDVDVSLPGLLNGFFGTRAHMARQAGKATSPAKAAAARVNGSRGGRPRKKAAG